MNGVNKDLETVNQAVQFLDELEQVQKRVAINQKKAAGKGGWIVPVVVILFLAIAGFAVFKVGAWLITPSDEEDYVTYYQDDNGNNTLDQGEWNYTEDEDGNVVDVDDDLSNFE